MVNKALIKVNDAVPDFTLKDQDGKDFKLSEHKGKRVLLSFHPLAWTEVCARQMQSLEEHKGTFDSLNTVPLGISIDSVPCEKAWAEYLKIESLRILSDFWPHGEVAQLCGLFREKNGFSERANVIVDGRGKVAWLKVYEIKQLPDIHEVLKALLG